MTFLQLIRKIIYRTLFKFDLIMGNKPQVFVLCYHSISNDWLYGVSVSEFKKQINFLAKFYNFLTADDLKAYLEKNKGIPTPSVLITFDDGYTDILKVKNFLKLKKIQPVLFLLSDENQVDRRELATDKSLLNKSQILGLKKSGWAIGSHGATHQDFWNLSDTQLKKEILDSKISLEKKLNCSINYFAYPKGRYNQKVLNQVKKAGYKLGFSMDDGFIAGKTNRLSLPRVGINQSHGFDEFMALFSPSVIQFRRLCKRVKLERAFT